MNKMLNICLVKASLPSYFPEKHDVWNKCSIGVKRVCDEVGVNFIEISEIPMNSNEAHKVLKKCKDHNADFILILHGGFTMGDVALTFAASNFRLGFWSVPEPKRTGDIQLNNFVSLNMSMSIAQKVRDVKKFPIKWFHCSPESNDFQKRLKLTLKSLIALKALSMSRIGLIGGLAMTFYNMEVSITELKSKLGIEVFNHDIHELTERMSQQPEDKVGSEVSKMLKVAKCDNVSNEQMELSSRAALSLRDITKENNYNALAVSDWPALQEISNMHPGAAFSWLEEIDEIPVASEGDVLGAVTQIIAKSLTGKVGYLLDMTEPDFETGKMLMWHGGGGPLYLANSDGVKWVNHPMIGRGTSEGPIYGTISDLVFKDGPVTVFRVSQNANSIFQMTSEVKGRNPNGFTGCRGWLENFQMEDESITLKDLVSTVMYHGIEHHFILIPGNLRDELNELSAWSGMNKLEQKHMKNYVL